MPDVRHPHPDFVYACPACDSSGYIVKRTRKSRNGAKPYCCSGGCGATFDAPDEREGSDGVPEPARVGPQSDIGQQLMDADPGDLGRS